MQGNAGKCYPCADIAPISITAYGQMLGSPDRECRQLRSTVKDFSRLPILRILWFLSKAIIHIQIVQLHSKCLFHPTKCLPPRDQAYSTSIRRSLTELYLQISLPSGTRKSIFQTFLRQAGSKLRFGTTPPTETVLRGRTSPSILSKMLHFFRATSFSPFQCTAPSCLVLKPFSTWPISIPGITAIWELSRRMKAA
jgi:hypothetical protein